MRRKVAALALVAVVALLSLPAAVQAGSNAASNFGFEPRVPEGPARSPVDPGDLPTPGPVPDETLRMSFLDPCGSRLPVSLTSSDNGIPESCDDPADVPDDRSPVQKDETGPVVSIPSLAGSRDVDHGVRPDHGPVQDASSASATPAPTDSSWSPMLRIVALAALAAGAAVPWLLAARSDDNELRERIYEMVVDDPGLSASRIADELDIHLTTAIYHLERLQEDNRIEGLEEGKSTLYFENHRRYGRVEKRVLTALRKDTASDVLSMVADNPGIHCAELARRMDLSRTSIKWHADRLADDGLLEKQPNGGTQELVVPDKAEELLNRHRAA